MVADVHGAAGLANVSITSTYLHVAVEDQAVGNYATMATSPMGSTPTGAYLRSGFFWI